MDFKNMGAKRVCVVTDANVSKLDAMRQVVEGLYRGRDRVGHGSAEEKCGLGRDCRDDIDQGPYRRGKVLPDQIAPPLPASAVAQGPVHPCFKPYFFGPRPDTPL